MTILNWSFPRKDVSRRTQAFQLALALRGEVADLEAAGCRVVQVQTALQPLKWSVLFTNLRGEVADLEASGCRVVQVSRTSVQTTVCVPLACTDKRARLARCRCAEHPPGLRSPVCLCGCLCAGVQQGVAHLPAGRSKADGISILPGNQPTNLWRRSATRAAERRSLCELLTAFSLQHVLQCECQSHWATTAVMYCRWTSRRCGRGCL